MKKSVREEKKRKRELKHGGDPAGADLQQRVASLAVARHPVRVDASLHHRRRSLHLLPHGKLTDAVCVMVRMASDV